MVDIPALHLPIGPLKTGAGSEMRTQYLTVHYSMTWPLRHRGRSLIYVLRRHITVK